MRVHHLNCISMCPPGGAFMDGHSHGVSAELVCHCLLLESKRGLVLIDTGFGLADVRAPDSRLSSVFLRMMRPRLREESTALRQIERLGYSARDVRHIVLTHLDFDHAGGLDDFPEARVHLLADEAVAADGQRSWLDRNRFRPSQWGSRARWVTYAPEGERWHGFEAVRAPVGLDEEVLLVPLIGHTFGHAGIAIARDGGYLLHCGDAYFFHGELEPTYRCPPGLRAYQAMMEVNRPMRIWNQERLRQLARSHAGEVELFCAHDEQELKRMQAAQKPNVMSERQPTQDATSMR